MLKKNPILVWFLALSLGIAPVFVVSSPAQADQVRDRQYWLQDYGIEGGPQSPGTHAWDELRGGECLASFESAFAEEFTVVGCDTPHPAQMVTAVLLSRDRTELFPGENAVAERAEAVCEVADLINPEVASTFSELVIDSAYPVSSEQWDAGQRVVYCFLYSSSGEVFEESLLAQR